MMLPPYSSTHLLTELLLPPATGEGWDGGDSRLIYAASYADNPSSHAVPIFMGKGDTVQHHNNRFKYF
jgi:hypothetical protein